MAVEPGLGNEDTDFGGWHRAGEVECRDVMDASLARAAGRGSRAPGLDDWRERLGIEALTRDPWPRAPGPGPRAPGPQAQARTEGTEGTEGTERTRSLAILVAIILSRSASFVSDLPLIPSSSA